MSLFKLFRRRRPHSKEESDKKAQTAQHGSNLRRLKDSTEWADLLLVKDSFQQNAGLCAVNTEVPDKSRFQAAVQWTCLENFFQEVSRRIKAGEEAQKALEEAQKAKTPL